MPIFRQNIIFFIKLTKVLEVANVRFLANLRFLTLHRVVKVARGHTLQIFFCKKACFSNKTELVHFILDFYSA